MVYLYFATIPTLTMCHDKSLEFVLAHCASCMNFYSKLKTELHLLVCLMMDYFATSFTQPLTLPLPAPSFPFPYRPFPFLPPPLPLQSPPRPLLHPHWSKFKSGTCEMGQSPSDPLPPLLPASPFYTLLSQFIT